MATSGERILLVESDPDISDLIARQALRPLGYQVDVVGDAASAIKKAAQTTPDLILANINLPGLSAKDLLVALASQGSQTPLIVLAEKGQEGAAIHAFRLGASDALFWPARDAEVVSSVERALKQVRERRARQKVDAKLEETNRELDRKVSELTTLLAIGKAVTSITDQRVLFQKIVEGALQVSSAEIGWLLLRDERSKAFLLTSHRNLPEVWAKKVGEPLDDGVSSLVALSGETLLIHGEPLQKFKISSLGRSVAVVPIKVQNEVIGLVLVVRKSAKPFERVEQALLEAMADYASISLVNARLFRALEQTAESARNGERLQNALLESMRDAIREEMQAAGYPLELLLTEKPGKLSAQQKQALQTIQMAHERLSRAVDRTTPPAPKSKK